MQLISKCNKGIQFLLCVIDTFHKYAWVILFKNFSMDLVLNQTKYRSRKVANFKVD